MAEVNGDSEEKPKSNTESQSFPPEIVCCDSCLDCPSGATKTCLTCLVSFCEAHLRPHLLNAKFQKHRLVDPLHDTDCRVCEVHCLPFMRFCLKDSCCLCPDCERHQHEGHPTISVREARSGIEAELQKKCEEISERVSDAERAVEQLKSNRSFIRAAVQEAYVVVEQQFALLRAAIKEARKQEVEALEGEKRAALRQAESIQAHVEQRRAELSRILTEMNKLSGRELSDVDFVQEYGEWKKGAADLSLPTVPVSRMDHFTSYKEVVVDATRELCGLILSYREKTSLTWKHVEYWRSLTFDPDTTHHFLRIMEDNKKLINTSPWQHSYPDHPDRFDHWHQALSAGSLYQGRHYIEAELGGEGAHVGLAYKGIKRKGKQRASCITGYAFSWCVGRDGRGFSAWHANAETPLAVGGVGTVGIYVDFQRGCLSFYDVTGGMKLLHVYRTNFSEPLYLTAWLSKNSDFIHLADGK
ncbi:unnamed protein product [Tetraodon nigroviridis]|uniref:(spotted green pufferfish) hypothetical protein n=1 Tax=Tetraodon nigroviridis TaxID=99883 RepID=Q4SGK4_TETNG|nr:unnamed protein product [Tetraodon nigroviridis]